MENAWLVRPGGTGEAILAPPQTLHRRPARHRQFPPKDTRPGLRLGVELKQCSVHNARWFLKWKPLLTNAGENFSRRFYFFFRLRPGRH